MQIEIDEMKKQIEVHKTDVKENSTEEVIQGKYFICYTIVNNSAGKEVNSMLKEVMSNQFGFQKEIADSHKSLWITMANLEKKIVNPPSLPTNS